MDVTVSGITTEVSAAQFAKDVEPMDSSPDGSVISLSALQL